MRLNYLGLIWNKREFPYHDLKPNMPHHQYDHWNELDHIIYIITEVKITFPTSPEKQRKRVVPWTSSPRSGVCQEVPFLRICFLKPCFPISLSTELGGFVSVAVSKWDFREVVAIEIQWTECLRSILQLKISRWWFPSFCLLSVKKIILLAQAGQKSNGNELNPTA